MVKAKEEFRFVMLKFRGEYKKNLSEGLVQKYQCVKVESMKCFRRNIDVIPIVD